MDGSPKVSVIVPVYNGEQYLNKCLTSIANQTLKDIEIIAVDDGSTDSSSSIIRSFVSMDSRIIHKHQLNKGVSEARNLGIETAKGKYIGFVDADDWIEPAMFETLYLQAFNNQCDLAICNSNVINNNATISTRLKLENEIVMHEKNKDQVIHDLIGFKFDYSNWNKIFLREIIVKNSVFFNQNIRIGEDLLFNLQFLLFSSKFITVDECLYNYVVHPNSTMQLNDQKSFEEFSKLIIEFELHCNRNCLTHYIMPFRLAFSKVYLNALVQNLRVSLRIKPLNEILNYYLPILKKNGSSNYYFNQISLKKHTFFQQIEIVLLKHKFFRCFLYLNYLKMKFYS